MDHKGQKEDKSRTLIWVIGGICVLLLLWFLVLSPAFKGYGIYKAMKAAGVPDDYLTDMQGLAQENQALTAARDAAQAGLTTCQDELASAKTSYDAERTEWEGERKQLTQRADAIESSLNEKSDEVAACESGISDMEDAVADAARRICCAQRIEHPEIDSYDITDGKIVCATDGEEGLSC